MAGIEKGETLNHGATQGDAEFRGGGAGRWVATNHRILLRGAEARAPEEDQRPVWHARRGFGEASRGPGPGVAARAAGTQEGQARPERQARGEGLADELGPRVGAGEADEGRPELGRAPAGREVERGPEVVLKDIRAILVGVFGIDEPPNITKSAAVKALEDAIKGDVDALVKIKALRPNETVIAVCAKSGGSPVGEPDDIDVDAGHDADRDAQDADGADANAESSADDDDDEDDVSPPEPTDDGSAGTGAGDGDELSDDGSCEGSDDGAGASSGEPEEAEEVATPPPPVDPVPTNARSTRRNKKRPARYE